MKQSYPGMNPEISDWKGQEITDFQEDLLIKVNGRLSEKWFYSHMKAFDPSLPRIDVLNMLSKYVGYSNWQDFTYKNSGKIPLAEKLKKSNIIAEPTRIDEITGKRFTFIFDPDNLPVELYEK